MKILEIKTLAGPNVYHHKPVLIATLDLEDLAETNSADIPGFIERITRELPGLAEHRCSPGRPGGFIERLHQGTYFGHVIEHIALELSDYAECSVGYGKTVSGDSPTIYRVVIRYTSEAGMKFLLQTAMEFTEAAIRGAPYPLQEKIASAKEIVRNHELGPSTRAIVEAAEARRIPWLRLNENNLIQLGYGIHRKFIQATTSSLTGDIAVDIASDKGLTKQLLERAAIPVPRGKIVRTEEDAAAALAEFASLVVVKPLDGHQGLGVSLGLTTESEVKRAFQIAVKYSNSILVEEVFAGTDYRILVVNGKMIAAAQRIPACVAGDGSHSVLELVEIENRNPNRDNGHAKPMTKIDVDEICQNYLARKGYSLESVPLKGEVVFLRETANLSTGGSARDVTDSVHPEIRVVCERAARVIGLDICGIDLVVPDISAPLTSGGIIEVNAGPGIRMHHFPSEGKPRNAGGAIIDMLYPSGSSGRIPILSVTGTNGKTTVVRMIAHVLMGIGHNVGSTTTDGIAIGGFSVKRGDMTGPASARTVLCDPGVEVAVLETARGGILKRGLGYDCADVGIITNIQSDHIGQDGIESLDDILRIKSLVAETVKPGGTIILNAEDSYLTRLAEQPRIKNSKCHIVFFSLDFNSEVLTKHVQAGEKAYFRRNGWIVESDGGREMQIVPVVEVPATFHGTASFQIQNVLAAVAACRTFGVSVPILARALREFEPAIHNFGRVNAYSVPKGHLIVDYGHNAEAFRAIAEMTSRWKRKTSCVLALPGDRTNALVEQAAKAATGFDKIIIREDSDLRGRKSGELAALICAAVRRYRPGAECKIILDQKSAFRAAIDEMEEGECVVFLYEDYDLVTSELRRIEAKPITSVSDLFLKPNRGLLAG